MVGRTLSRGLLRTAALAALLLCAPSADASGGGPALGGPTCAQRMPERFQLELVSLEIDGVVAEPADAPCATTISATSPNDVLLRRACDANDGERYAPR